jgi:hypothetical protein
MNVFFFLFLLRAAEDRVSDGRATPGIDAG